MGFYSPRVIVDEARRCGIQIFGADVQASDVSATADSNGIRLGLATVSGVGENGGAQIVAARGYGLFTSLTDFCQRTRLGRRAVEALILGGAFDGWAIPRRQLVWDLGAAMETIGGPPQLDIVEPGTRPAFPRATDTERLWMEVATTGVTAQGHLVQTVAQTLRAMGGDTDAGAGTLAGKVSSLRTYTTITSTPIPAIAAHSAVAAELSVTR